MNRSARLFLLLFVALVASPARAQRDLTDIPVPDTAAEMEAMRLDPACEVNAYATDPMIRKPIQMNFDARGRLWVASSEVYPQLRPGEKADDKIIVLEDTNGDGTADSHTVFADGLLIPTGVLPDGTDSAYVAASTELLHLSDTDGDGRADRRRVVLSGFGTEDTHHLIHTLRWGPDGCVYFNQSIYIHSSVDTAYGTRHLDGGGIWRYRPETGELEVFCRGFVNPWGHVFDAYGQSLVTDGAYFEGINYAFPDSVFVTAPGATRWLSGMNPGSPKHCGLTILSGSHIPEQWQGDLVTCDFRSHRVCRFTIRPEGSGYQSRQQPEVLTSEHIAFRPIDAAVGPDGALYIADWYNPIIQHGEVDFRDERRDRAHGRIWRVAFEGRPLAERPDFASLDADALAALLDHVSLQVRQFAREELKRRDPEAARSAASRFVDAAADDLQRSRRAMEAMWIDECHNAVDAERIAQVFAAEDGRVRAAAVRVIGRRRSQIADADSLLRQAVADSHPQVRLEAVAALGRGWSAEDASTALAALSQPLDENLDFALWNASRQLAPLWTPRLAEGTFDYGDDPQRLAFALSAAGSPAAVAPVIDSIADPRAAMELSDAAAAQMVVAVAGVADPGQLARLVEIVLTERGWAGDQRAEMLAALVSQSSRRGVRPTGADEVLRDSFRANFIDPTGSASLADQIVAAATAWKIDQLASDFVTVMAKDSAAIAEDRAVKMIAALGAIGTGEAVEFLVRLGNDSQASPARRAAVIVALARPAQDQSLSILRAMLSGEPAARRAAIDALPAMLSQQGTAERLTELVAGITVPADDARRMVSTARSASAPESLIEAIRTAGSLADASWKWSDQLRDQVLELAEHRGSAARGEAIYRRASLQCINCHQIGPAGGLVGPNLVSLGGGAPPEYILRSLIEPDDKLKEGFSTVRVLTVDGQVVQGIPAGDDETTMQLRIADGTVVSIPRDDIEEESTGQSLMPVGLVDALTLEELADLTRFLSELGRTPAYTLSTAPIVRSLETLVYSDEANHLLNRTSTDAVTSDSPAMQWRMITSRVDGSIPLDELDRFQQHNGIPPSSYLRFQVDQKSAGTVNVQLPETEGLQMWVDGRPTPTWQADRLELSAGTHHIILAVDHDAVKTPLVIELLGS